VPIKREILTKIYVDIVRIRMNKNVISNSGRSKKRNIFLKTNVHQFKKNLTTVISKTLRSSPRAKTQKKCTFFNQTSPIRHSARSNR
jgi:hypothetical protein